VEREVSQISALFPNDLHAQFSSLAMSLLRQEQRVAPHWLSLAMTIFIDINSAYRCGAHWATLCETDFTGFAYIFNRDHTPSSSTPALLRISWPIQSPAP